MLIEYPLLLGAAAGLVTLLFLYLILQTHFIKKELVDIRGDLVNLVEVLNRNQTALIKMAEQREEK